MHKLLNNCTRTALFSSEKIFWHNLLHSDWYHHLGSDRYHYVCQNAAHRGIWASENGTKYARVTFTKFKQIIQVQRFVWAALLLSRKVVKILMECLIYVWISLIWLLSEDPISFLFLSKKIISRRRKNCRYKMFPLNGKPHIFKAVHKYTYLF